MPSDKKAAYLAAHYLTADSKPSSSSTKKRKRKQPAATSGLLITDDDETGWGSSRNDANNNDEDDTPLTVAGTTTDFRRTKKNTWKTIGGAPSTTATTPSSKEDAAAADAIIASAAAESLALTTSADDADDPTPEMSNGTLAGLQSASSLTAQLRRRQAAEAAELAALQLQTTQTRSRSHTPEIILRDATGRRVDASLARAQARRAAERTAHAKTDLLRGEVQAAQARARRERLEEAALMPLARGKDDAEMNDELRQAERWNDPMAEFLAAAGGGGGQEPAAGKKKGGGRRPVYKGAAAPNRYGIRPGYRWDGVDRGTGFEGERFKALNRKERDKGLEYAWQMDV
jgi:pre-mRNA-splicing factor CWC26